MPTIKQKKLAQAIVENMESDKPKTMKELVVSSGYDMTTAIKQVPAVIEQKGVQEELAKLGFTEERAKSVVAEIMNNDSVEPNTRLKAADMTIKVFGGYAAEKKEIVELHIDGSEELKKMAALLQTNDRQRLFGNGEQSGRASADAMDKEVSDKE